MNVTEQVAFAKKLDSAKQAAANATFEYINKNGENPMGCGFAWVEVSKVRGKKLDFLKVYGFKKKYDGPGFSLWNPSGHYTQDMDAKYAGAQAFVEVLEGLGLNAVARCRLD